MIIKRKQYREIPLAVEKYKAPGNLLKHVKEDSDGIMLLDKDSEELIGYIAWKGDYIVALEVISNFRGKGFGEELLEKAIKKGCRKLSVNRNNIPAINLYKKLGFRKNNTDLGPKQIEMELI